ncbi:hypothetical protein COS93_00275 [bacterium (Candidatus Gribaldobacteria) CG07_land_8_20_14_0_80_33_18]|uniref:PDZ domain-containing protein n=1 Tax=bacterium (Candidatus Gribaldobacteria) CG07_land_8_20_14_0_80_33_18 TaxID=2014272 RepID=A0A2M6Z4K5_9BACT|nr:MAG: hypothetical protein COU04_01320 [bacterium (Candidatus Gribaldobacteria) CG10_big_fil_rev_8_21_14_0_10_33_41]PIU47247.1 MAG: hypothetical protein COS93_00275 [bacterium (Candidatus Gribaldobacteria) CG07_land_8_20_14_0_80_33_18]PJA01192.1 MAG: hypothetical protein COX75_00405 [bacterium (Candidatus Gribaldobacteria) CG_4_10_14_0_2_um_filter_33_15]PJB08791.1 MAG: hypothetical protein CO122_00850 [bacterium (Candidatus Gribaldobacteria) CG_4_9_14_3_um_filter_33_9]
MAEKSQIINTVKKVLPAVVTISISKYLEVFESPFGFLGEELFGLPQKKKIKIGGGSGFIIDKDGIILTNRHVIADENAEYVVILPNGEKFRPKILFCDAISDVGILKINTKKNNLPIIGMGDSSKLDLGQTVIAIGNALGLFQNTVSVGVISGLSREIRAADALAGKETKLRGLIQTDAAINPGNSGGPLVDIEGNVIGINVATVFGAENIGFSLPINNAKKILEEFKKYGRVRQPFLGIRYILLNKILKEKYNLPASFGALVVSEPNLSLKTAEAVIPGSPADRAGLMENDVILEMEQEKITPENTLSDILQNFKVGQEIPLKILREGKEKLLKIILTEKS